jgi:hypothetical protein
MRSASESKGDIMILTRENLGALGFKFPFPGGATDPRNIAWVNALSLPQASGTAGGKVLPVAQAMPAPDLASLLATNIYGVGYSPGYAYDSEGNVTGYDPSKNTATNDPRIAQLAQMIQSTAGPGYVPSAATLQKINQLTTQQYQSSGGIASAGNTPATIFKLISSTDPALGQAYAQFAATPQGAALAQQGQQALDYQQPSGAKSGLIEAIKGIGIGVALPALASAAPWISGFDIAPAVAVPASTSAAVALEPLISVSAGAGAAQALAVSQATAAAVAVGATAAEVPAIVASQLAYDAAVAAGVTSAAIAPTISAATAVTAAPAPVAIDSTLPSWLTPADLAPSPFTTEEFVAAHDALAVTPAASVGGPSSAFPESATTFDTSAATAGATSPTTSVTVDSTLPSWLTPADLAPSPFTTADFVSAQQAAQSGITGAQALSTAKTASGFVSTAKGVIGMLATLVGAGSKAGSPINPATGAPFPIDPRTGRPYDPATGLPIDNAGIQGESVQTVLPWLILGGALLLAVRRS